MCIILPRLCASRDVRTELCTPNKRNRKHRKQGYNCKLENSNHRKELPNSAKAEIVQSSLFSDHLVGRFNTVGDVLTQLSQLC